MHRHLFSVTALLAASTSAMAQDLPQAKDAFFTAGQATIEQRLANQPITGTAKNVILFVADGQGVGTNYAIRLFSGQKAGGTGDDYVQPQETFPNSALIKTYTVNGQTPDSAPTAGAMNTGVKQKNGMINIDGSVAEADCAGGIGHEQTTFAEIASGMGKSVGVVSTARITHATPAAVFAKTASRDWESNADLPENCAQKDIAAQLIDMMQSGVVDLAMGGGRSMFLPTDVTDEESKAGKRTDGRNLVEEFKAMGGQYAWDETGFQALTTGANAPVLGLFEPSHMKYESDRSGEPSLTEMTEAAIKNLSGNDSGFYLEIEGGRVDHANHAGNAARMVEDGKAFADAVAKAMEMTDPAETLIIVTADHEHGIAFNGYCGRGTDILGLCMDVDPAGEMHTDKPLLGDDGKPFTVIGYLNGPGAVLTEQADKTYSGTRPELTQEQATDIDYLQQALIPMASEAHSGEDVPLFARGPWAHLFGGVMEQNVIFHVMNYAVAPK
jgi:alkaline phosphatase